MLHAPKRDIELSNVDASIIEVRGPKEPLATLRRHLRWQLDEARPG